jgi:hypothetical protein
MAGETKEIPILQQIGHYSGVLGALTTAHHTVRTSGTCAEHGTTVTPSSDSAVKAVESAMTDVSRLVSKLVSMVEKDITPRMN